MVKVNEVYKVSKNNEGCYSLYQNGHCLVMLNAWELSNLSDQITALLSQPVELEDTHIGDHAEQDENSQMGRDSQ